MTNETFIPKRCHYNLFRIYFSHHFRCLTPSYSNDFVHANLQINVIIIVILLNQTRAWFLIITFVRECLYACVFARVCVFAPEAINNQWHDVV